MNGPRRAFTDAEFARTHRELERSPGWERALFHTFAATGLRMNEVCNLNVGAEQVATCGDLIVIDQRTQGTCEIPITPEFARALTALRSAQPRRLQLPGAPLIAADRSAPHPAPLSRKELTRVSSG